MAENIFKVQIFGDGEMKNQPGILIVGYHRIILRCDISQYGQLMQATLMTQRPSWLGSIQKSSSSLSSFQEQIDVNLLAKLPVLHESDRNSSPPLSLSTAATVKPDWLSKVLALEKLFYFPY